MNGADRRPEERPASVDESASRRSGSDQRSRLRFDDLVGTAVLGLRARIGRSILTAIGIAVGVAAIVAVLGISASSRSELLRVLDTLGTNLIRVGAGQSFGGGNSELPDTALGMIERIGPVEAVAQATSVDANVYRNDLVPVEESGGIGVFAVSDDLLGTIGVEPIVGRGLGDGALPVAVVGSVAAQRLGLVDSAVGTRDSQLVYVGNEWFTVVGILAETELHPDIDRGVMIGYPVAEALFGTDTTPSTLFVRADPEDIEDVNTVLAATANPQAPNEIDVSRPSDALVAQQAAEETFTSLLLGLGSVALLVGGIAIANVMVMSVLERRMEIGVRRALGATKRQIRAQFVAESIALSGIGGVAGVLIGGIATVVYANVQGWDVTLPVFALVGCVVAALAIGAAAGFYPAMRAAQIAPSEAVRAA